MNAPELFISTLEHDYNKIFNITVKNGKNIKRKDSDMKPTANHTQKNTQPNRRAAANKKKKIIISIIAAALAVCLVVALILLFNGNNAPSSTVSTSYKIQEVTVGNVSTTVSGSGSLTPVTSKTLTAAELIEELEEEAEGESEESESSGDESTQTEGIAVMGTGVGVGTGTSVMPQTPPTIVGGIVKSVNVQVGDTVEAGEVIAVITVESYEADGEDGSDSVTTETRNILAPYNAVILEWYLSEGDEVADDTSVGMFMGIDDGYAMNISVDETNISFIALGQEVEIKIDASSEEMPTGAVTDISYNGSTSGSTTAYKITVTFDYVEGTYPGMSVSAEIVIEDSGEGLLVPVSAVQMSGDTKYVYLAPSGATLATVYGEEDIDLTKLTRVTVTTGISNGTYIMIESGELEKGDLVVEITRTSTQTGSNSSDGSGGRGDFSDFGGGFPSGFPGGGGMPEGFDPSQFGGGGMFPGFDG